MKKIIGIYGIKNLLNGKMYVGQSKDIKHRWRSHRMELRNNRHINNHLQRAYNKYGEEYFVFGIIEECAIEDMNDREFYWVQYYDTFKMGYNGTLPNPKTGKRTFTEEEKETHRQLGIKRWNKLSKEEKERRIKLLSEQQGCRILRKITLYDKVTLEEKYKFNSLVECAEFFNISIKKFSKILTSIKNEEVNTYKGYYLIKETTTLEAFLNKIKIKKLNRLIDLAKQVAGTKRRVTQNRLSNKLSPEEFSKIQKIKSDKVQENKRLSGKYELNVYTTSGEFVGNYKLLTDAIKDLNLNLKQCRKAIYERKTNKYKGYLFERVN